MTPHSLSSPLKGRGGVGTPCASPSGRSKAGSPTSSAAACHPAEGAGESSGVSRIEGKLAFSLSIQCSLGTLSGLDPLGRRLARRQSPRAAHALLPWKGEAREWDFRRGFLGLPVIHLPSSTPISHPNFFSLSPFFQTSQAERHDAVSAGSSPAPGMIMEVRPSWLLPPTPNRGRETRARALAPRGRERFPRFSPPRFPFRGWQRRRAMRGRRSRRPAGSHCRALPRTCALQPKRQHSLGRDGLLAFSRRPCRRSLPPSPSAHGAAPPSRLSILLLLLLLLLLLFFSFIISCIVVCILPQTIKYLIIFKYLLFVLVSKNFEDLSTSPFIIL